ncbi:MAG: hypothetical protein H7281_10610 [Bacteriovorax sp.]|nr:hypothetical protein [Bacteriovorax sp.]
MALKNSALTLLLVNLISIFGVEARIVLPELLTKQAVNNIRFLSNDGKFTYYQKRSGSLLFSTNYKVQEMLKSDIGTNYTIFASPARKKMIILQNVHFHNFYSLRAKENIFLVNYGESVPREVGTGTSPNLLLNDTWLSYYDPYTKVLNFENTSNAALKFSIKLNNRLNPYFIPQVLMSDENTVYYTDLSEVGIYGVLEFKRNTSKSEIIFKAPSAMIKAEICLNQDQLIMGVFGIHFSKIGSSISKSPLPIKDFSKRENLYTSELNDLGHLVCDFDKDNIAFIKNTGNINSPRYDIANLNTSDKKITALSEKKTVTNIINMDGTLLTQEKGKYYIVKGEVDFKNIDTLKAKPDAVPGINAEKKDLEDE